MDLRMTSVALLCLLLLERFLASDIDEITEPVLNTFVVLEENARLRNILPHDATTKLRQLSRFYIFTPELRSGGRELHLNNQNAFLYFDNRLDTKVIIHGFLDKVKIANWMHHMKDEFLLLDDFNIIVVDWSSGNFIPYSTAAANTQQVGEEISEMLAILVKRYGARPETFHLIGHSLGSHVAGYVGERIKGIGRITGLDPATFLFTDASPRARLDRSDALFVDAIHTDAGGIGVVEPVGHVDFYPNGGEVQPGCTASNSLRALLQEGVVEGARNLICSHMRAPLIFTDSINTRHCEMVGHECSSWEDFQNGSCVSCGQNDENCAVMGYHLDINRRYRNASKHYLITANESPYCGFQYKFLVNLMDGRKRFQRGLFQNVWRRSTGWTSSDVLHVNLYGINGAAEFKIQGRDQGSQSVHLVLSRGFLGDVTGAVLRWSKKPLSSAVTIISRAMSRVATFPIVESVEVTPLGEHHHWRHAPISFRLCASPMLTSERSLQGSSFRSDYC